MTDPLIEAGAERVAGAERSRGRQTDGGVGCGAVFVEFDIERGVVQHRLVALQSGLVGCADAW